MSLPAIYTAALVGVWLLAFSLGSREARAIATGYLLQQVLGSMVDSGKWGVPQLGVFLLDLLLLGWLIWIISKSALMWPIALGVLQTLTVLGHIARLTVPNMEKMGYYVLLQWTAWPAFLAMLIGIGLDWRAERTSVASWHARG